MGRPYGLMPVGAPALINLLRENDVPVKGISYPLERQLNPAFDLGDWLKRQHGARLIMIDLHWYEHTYGAIKVAQVCKRVLPTAKMVVGGFTASAFSKKILGDFSAIDFVIRGDAEIPLLQLALHLTDADGSPRLQAIPNLSHRRNERIVENARTYCAASDDLDRLNFADLDFLEHADQYYMHEYIVTDVEAARRALDGSPFRGRWVGIARGCWHECSFCGGCESAQEALAGRTGVVARSPEKVLGDLRRLQNNGVHQASLSHDIAEMGEDYWDELFQGMRHNGLEIGIYNECFQVPSPDFIETFARSVDMEHSCLALSPLSGSEAVRRLNGKRYTNDQLFHLLDYLNFYNIPIFVYFSLNLPGEDEGAFEETLELAKRIYDHYPSSLLKILTSCHTIDPLSPMSKRPGEYAVTVDLSTFEDYYEYCRQTQFGGPDARTSRHRGFEMDDPDARSVASMAEKWDAARKGREQSWWLVPPSW